MYFIKIYNKDRSIQLRKFRNFHSLVFDEQLNSYGSATMKLSLKDVSVSYSDFAKFNKISIYKDDVEKWRGYISDYTVNEFDVVIQMFSVMKLLEKRLITKEYTSQNVVTVFEDIINTMNTAFSTNFTYGGTDVSGTTQDFNFQNATVLSALQSCSQSVAGEIYIDDDDKIWLYSQIGSDKTDTVIFKFLQNKMVENNIQKLAYSEQGDEVYNYIIGENDEEPPKSSTQSDVGIGEDRLEKFIKFKGIVSQDALDEATTDHLNKHKETRKNHTINPLSTKISETLYSIGDLCKMKMKYGFINFDENYRIVRKNYEVMRSGTSERMTVELGNNALTKDDFFKRISNMEKRLADLEK